MHEAGAVNAAIGQALCDWPVERVDGALVFEIRDATRASEDSVGFYAASILRELGLEQVGFTVRTEAAACEMCGAASLPTVAHPVCAACGAPVRRLPGPAILCHVEGTLEPVTPVSADPSGGAAVPCA
jgi:ribosomal protein L37E